MTNVIHNKQAIEYLVPYFYETCKKMAVMERTHVKTKGQSKPWNVRHRVIEMQLDSIQKELNLRASTSLNLMFQLRFRKAANMVQKCRATLNEYGNHQEQETEQEYFEKLANTFLEVKNEYRNLLQMM